ncbi:hypothetical protein D6T64_18245 [Cryobacterium melibiosiphilum]|uniref:SipW-cognate class signal peptide n=1 Tax=Cryobacterium melibiosiphilum TaxID=995039 RepID=A0A3A5MFL7_9MICO|nr:hypothetical protein [Cryobacterium melibiosiphilum]RJT86207.1 hypothetical protein D6T64_18245 [Cryobacterium melibiosiphilum]
MTIAPTSLLKRFPLRAVLASGAVLGLGTILTFAAFTDEGSVSAEFSTGNVDIAFDGGAQGTPTPYVSKLAVTDAKIGTTVYRPLIVNNLGTIDFSYTVAPKVDTAVTTNSMWLAAALNISVIRVSALDDCKDDGVGFRAVEAAAAAAGTPLVTVPVSAVNTLVLPVSPILAGTKSTLAAPVRDIFCFRVALPGATGGTVAENNAEDSKLMNKTLRLRFDFVATQTAVK